MHNREGYDPARFPACSSRRHPRAGRRRTSTMPVPMAVPELRADAPPEEAPDLIEPIVGWRVWDVVESEEGLLLSSLCFRATWPPRRAMLASCRRSSLNIGRVRLTG